MCVMRGRGKVVVGVVPPAPTCEYTTTQRRLSEQPLAKKKPELENSFVKVKQKNNTRKADGGKR